MNRLRESKLMASRAVLTVFLLFQASFLLAADQVGKAKLVVSNVIVISADAVERGIKTGDAVYEGDVVKTGDRGFAVIVLADNTKFTVKPKTEFKIARVSSQDEDKQVLTSLLKGGLKVVTGQIAKTNPKGFKVNTTLGSIGVRGTKFDVWICLDNANCELEYGAFKEEVNNELSGQLLFVSVIEGVTVLQECAGSPEVAASKMGISDGTPAGCLVIDVPPELSQAGMRKKDQDLDESMSTLEAPLLPQFEFGDVLSICQGDPICIQCDGDPACMQCNGDPSCYECQSDPLCSQCEGDASCISCNGDPLCIQCNGDSLCMSCNADNSCIQCNGNALCIACNNDPLCLCDGDSDCQCGIDPTLPQCLIEEESKPPVAPDCPPDTESIYCDMG